MSDQNVLSTYEIPGWRAMAVFNVWSQTEPIAAILAANDAGAYKRWKVASRFTEILFDTYKDACNYCRGRGWE